MGEACACRSLLHGSRSFNYMVCCVNGVDTEFMSVVSLALHSSEEAIPKLEEITVLHELLLLHTEPVP